MANLKTAVWYVKQKFEFRTSSVIATITVTLVGVDTPFGFLTDLSHYPPRSASIAL